MPPDSDYYGGEKPQSEEETKFLVELIDNNKFDAIIAIHAPFKIINYDCGTDCPITPELARKISEILNYPVQKDIGYPTPGSFGTYCGVERKIPTITIEIDEEAELTSLVPKFIELFKYLENDF
jgi:protein MpaA